MMESLLQAMSDPRLANPASVIGLVVTVIGFAVTIWNVSRTRKAAEAAETAAVAARERVTKTEALSDFAAAIAHLDELKRLHREKAWAILPDRYSHLKKMLISVRHADPGLSDDHKARIQGAIQHLATMERRVEEGIAKGEGGPDVPRLNLILSKLGEALTEVLVELRNQLNR